MKKLILFLVLVVGMTASIFASNDDSIRYVIVYLKGIDTLVQKAGDNIGGDMLVFYEQDDDFFRGEPINGVIPFSSHGYKFWLKNVRMEEDTMTGSLKILSAIVTEDPNTLLASVVEHTGGDSNSPSDPPITLIYQLWIGLICLIAIVFCLWLWLRKKPIRTH